MRTPRARSRARRAAGSTPFPSCHSDPIAVGSAVINRLAGYTPFALLIGVIAALVPPQGNDFFQFWYAGHLVGGGGSPYDQAAWTAASAYGPLATVVTRQCPTPDAPTCLWLYPPWTAWLYAPFGLADPATGVIAIAALTLAALVGGILFAVRTYGAPPAWRGSLVLASAAAWAPVEQTAVTGHFLGLSLIGLVLVDRGLRERRVAPFVAGAALLSLKPNLVLVLATVLAVAMVRARSWGLVTASAVVVGLVVVSLLTDPRALPALAAGTAPKISLVPGNTSLFRQPSADGAVAALLLLVTAAAAALVIVRDRRPAAGGAALVAVAAAVSLAAAPYAHAYDLVLLIPALLLIGGAGRTGLAVLLALVGASWLSYALELAKVPASFPGLIPVAALAALALLGTHRDGAPRVRLAERAPAPVP